MDFAGETLSWRHDGPDGAIVEVDLHRAPLNEIGTATLRELEILARYVEDGASGARALILASSRPGFCAGADLRELYVGLTERRDRVGRRAADLLGRAGPLARPATALLLRAGRALVRREIRAFLDRIHAVFDTLDQAPLATFAAVHGVVFGGGFELALTADTVIADKTARFCFPELRLGLVPGFGGVPRLQREVGSAVVRDLLLSGRSLGATRAYELGLVGQLVSKGEARAAAHRAALQALRYASAATLAAKRLAKRLPREELAQEKELFCDLVTDPAVWKALNAFVHDPSVRPYLPATEASDG